jgi:hypothetical protein
MRKINGSYTATVLKAQKDNGRAFRREWRQGGLNKYECANKSDDVDGVSPSRHLATFPPQSTCFNYLLDEERRLLCFHLNGSLCIKVIDKKVCILIS